MSSEIECRVQWKDQSNDVTESEVQHVQVGEARTHDQNRARCVVIQVWHQVSSRA